MRDVPPGLNSGDRVPEFTLLRGHQDVVESSVLFAAGPVVIHFWLFDFTGSEEGG